MSDRERILVTGFPGFRARFIVKEIVRADERAEVLALVHPKAMAEAQKIAATYPSDRLALIEGDPAAIDFGLSGSAYCELARSVGIVHHAFQVLELSERPQVAERVNVGGTREIVEFGRAATRLSRIVHYSSVFVSGNRSGVVREDELERGQGFRSSVEESLATAEQMLRRERGLPLTVVRTAQIVGDTENGEAGRLDGPYPLLVFLASAPPGGALPLPPRSDALLHVVPVDYVAEAGVYLGRAKSALGRTVHLVDPEALSARRFLEIAAERFGKRLESGFNAAAVTRAVVGNPAASLLARRIRGIAELVTNTARYDDRSAVELLAPAGIVCPPISSYLPVLLSHVEARVSEKRLEDDREDDHDVAS
jgi:thioester reductase-like protein